MGTSDRTLNGANHATIRYFMQFTIMATIIKVKNLDFFGPKEHFKLLFTRGIVGSTSIILKFFAIKFIRPSDVAALKNCHVIATTILAKFFLNEVLTLIHFIAISLTLVGIICVSRPEFIFESREKLSVYHFNSTNTTALNLIDSQNAKRDALIGVILILISSTFLGSTQVILRKLGTFKVHFANTNIYPAFIGLPSSTIISLIILLTENKKIHAYNGEENLFLHILYSVTGGLFGIMAICCLSKSLEYEEASRVSIIRLTDVIFAFLFQYLFLKISSDYLDVVGILLIISGTLLITVHKPVLLAFKNFKNNYNDYITLK